MGTATRKVAATLTVLAAAVAVSPVASADPDPAAPNVQYVLNTSAPYEFQIMYVTTPPPSKEAFNANADAYLKRERLVVTPEAPLVIPASLADPEWAYFWASSTTKGGVGAPNPTCQILVDGQVSADVGNPYSPLCQLSKW